MSLLRVNLIVKKKLYPPALFLDSHADDQVNKL